MIEYKDIIAIRHNYDGRDHNNQDYHETDNLGFGWIHYALIRNLKPQRLLCVGSQRGYVPAIMGIACRDEAEGLIDFVDAGLDERLDEPNNWGGLGIWKTATKDYWKPIECQDIITIHCMTTEEFAKGLKNEMYGYIYIDGDHSYEGVLEDFRRFWPYLQSGGMMVFHDIDVDKQTKSGKCGVKQFWDELENWYEEYDKISINKSAGLGIVQKG